MSTVSAAPAERMTRPLASRRLLAVNPRRTLKLAVVYGVSLLLIFFVLAPIVWMFISSISTRQELYAVPHKHWIPQQPTLDNFRTILTTGPSYRDGGFVPTAELLALGFRNTMLTSIVGASLITILATAAGYVFARVKFRGRRMAFLAIMLLMPLPIWVSLSTLFFTMSQLGLTDSNMGLILIYVATGLPLQLWIMTTFIRDLPVNVEEAAAIDGASRWQIVWHIVIPVARAGMTSVFLISALGIWNAFLAPLIIGSSKESQPLTVVLSLFIGQYEVAWEVMSAATVLVMVPPLALAFFFQRYLVRGMVAGASSDE
jgi:multiple sugar transport system permease protein